MGRYPLVIPLVSLLCPAYNEEEHIGEFIESLLAQSATNWEAIFVDDGSTDGTVHEIERYTARDSRLRLVSKGVKLGKTKAFNLAFSKSTGQIIALCGTDDVLPRDSVLLRQRALSGTNTDRPALAFFKIRTMSEDPRYDNLTLPRGAGVSKSGGSLTLTRMLADRVFPIDDSLIAEDIWLGRAAEALADIQIECPEVVLNYRIHPGNSHPRYLPFAEFNEALHSRLIAYRLLLETDRFTFSHEDRATLQKLAAAEEHRYGGRLLDVLRLQLPWRERLAIASQTRPTLYRLRVRFNRLLTGRLDR